MTDKSKVQELRNALIEADLTDEELEEVAGGLFSACETGCKTSCMPGCVTASGGATE